MALMALLALIYLANHPQSLPCLPRLSRRAAERAVGACQRSLPRLPRRAVGACRRSLP